MKTANKAGEILRLFEKTFDQMMAYTVRYVDTPEAENLCHEAYIELLNENEGRYIDENRLFRCLRQIIAERIDPFFKLQYAINQWIINSGDSRKNLPTPTKLTLIQHAFCALPDHQKRALQLTVCDGCETSNVSIQLGISENTLREWINHGLETIYQRVA